MRQEISNILFYIQQIKTEQFAIIAEHFTPPEPVEYYPKSSSNWICNKSASGRLCRLNSIKIRRYLLKSLAAVIFKLNLVLGTDCRKLNRASRYPSHSYYTSLPLPPAPPAGYYPARPKAPLSLLSSSPLLTSPKWSSPMLNLP